MSRVLFTSSEYEKAGHLFSFRGLPDQIAASDPIAFAASVTKRTVSSNRAKTTVGGERGSKQLFHLCGMLTVKDVYIGNYSMLGK